jgi:hypothetical protein
MSIQSEWDILTSDIRSFALQRVAHHSARARELIISETQKFIERLPPTDSVGLKLWYLQGEAVRCIKIDGISHADQIANQHPRVADKIFDEVKRLCDLALPKSDEEKHSQYQISSEVTQRIAAICYSDCL